MTDTSNGTPWTVLDIRHYKNGRRMGDGDTLDALRTRPAQLGDHWYQLTDLEHVGIRLAWVDTPEKGDPDYQAAITDLNGWLMRKASLGPLTVLCFGSAGWDRILADLVAADGESAPQWLMTKGNGGAGWPAYEKGK